MFKFKTLWSLNTVELKKKKKKDEEWSPMWQHMPTIPGEPVVGGSRVQGQPELDSQRNPAFGGGSFIWPEV